MSKLIEIECDYCGEPFLREKKDIDKARRKNYKGQYCSVQHSHKHRTIKAAHPFYKAKRLSIYATAEDVDKAVQLHAAGTMDTKIEIQNILSLTDEGYNKFILMFMNGLIYYYDDKGNQQKIKLDRESYRKVFFTDLHRNMKPEELYGVDGGLPEVIEFDFSDETVGNYKTKRNENHS